MSETKSKTEAATKSESQAPAGSTGPSAARTDAAQGASAASGSTAPGNASAKSGGAAKSATATAGKAPANALAASTATAQAGPQAAPPPTSVPAQDAGLVSAEVGRAARKTTTDAAASTTDETKPDAKSPETEAAAPAGPFMPAIQAGLVVLPPPPPSSPAPPPPVAGSAAFQAQAQAAVVHTGVGTSAPASAVQVAGAFEDGAKPGKESGEAGGSETARLSAAIDAPAGTAPLPFAAALALQDVPVPATQPHATQASAAPVPLGAVPMTIGLRSLAGSNHFEIRLDPKDLGRIDVNLDIDKDLGTVKAHLVVDRPETLALLQRDAGSLQQALSQAGLDAAADGSINLSLRSDAQSSGQGSEERRPGSSTSSGRSGVSDQADPRLTPDAVPLVALRGLGGIDIRI